MEAFLLSFEQKLFSNNCSLFLNTCFLTCKFTQIIKFCTTNFTDLIDSDTVDTR